jgi:hypothetical protein
LAVALAYFLLYVACLLGALTATCCMVSTRRNVVQLVGYVLYVVQVGGIIERCGGTFPDSKVRDQCQLYPPELLVHVQYEA